MKKLFEDSYNPGNFRSIVVRVAQRSVPTSGRKVFTTPSSTFGHGHDVTSAFDVKFDYNRKDGGFTEYYYAQTDALTANDWANFCRRIVGPNVPTFGGIFFNNFLQPQIVGYSDF